MFLKSMELSGFKSFADKTVIRFDEGITGIVGPNGCGKSNVNDAIRWVLGEQSAKSLRTGSSMSDIIFSGSESRRPVNLARVTLVFDNTARIFDSPFDEIEITREIRRSGETACFLNKTPCRLKDINELVMDTGLGRDSLSIISQGNISAFADARPEERRSLFEEAAGVAKYKKRKKTSLGRLENMKENLDRVQDLIDTLSRQIESLKEQAESAREYIRLKDELSSTEISVLAIQITDYKNRLDELVLQLKEARARSALQAGQNEIKEKNLEEQRKQLFELDQQISVLQQEYTRQMEESYALQRRKDQLDEKRKYALEAADAKAKAESLQAMVEEVRFEVQDRQKRLDELQDKMNTQTKIVNSTQSRMDQAQRDLEQNRYYIQSLHNKKNSVENRLQAPVSHNQGVSAVLKNKNHLEGIEGTVSQLLVSAPEYGAALSSALGGASDQVVTLNEAAARNAIAWLKKSRNGRATFLPLSVCKARCLYPDQQQTLSECEGILGICSDFVQNDPKYDLVRMRLLGNIALADNLEHANYAARKLRYNVKIVTLDGDVVHAGGAMSGGSQKNNSVAALRKELAGIEEAITTASQKETVLQDALRKAQNDVSRERDLFMQIRIDYEKLDNVYKTKKEKLEDYLAQYEQLAGSFQAQGEIKEDSLVSQLSAIHAKLDQISSDLSVKRQQRSDLAEQSSQLEDELRKIRREQSALAAQIHSMELEQTKLETKLEEALSRLGSEYSLTYEAAMAQKKDIEVKSSLSRIKSLRQQIARLGDVNLQAPKQLEENETQFNFLTSQKKELEDAARQILEAVEEMDQTMIRQFTEMFNKINDQLDGVFKAMFGGGHASLSMTDPDDVLNTGIDIDVQPPGKMVKNIQTFSGGEKALIAISVLFAILKARTIPLCIFDEVEAALDQANVERFARYLQHFKDQSQFIVVTHRPGTMEECDTLYGVTMQKDGVSQVLKVQLKDAAEYTKEQA